LTFFNERNIEVIVGARGDAKAAVEAYCRVLLNLLVLFAMNMSTTMNVENETGL